MTSLTYVIKDAVLAVTRASQGGTAEQRRLRLEGIEAVVQQAWLQGHLEDAERDELVRCLQAGQRGPDMSGVRRVV